MMLNTNAPKTGMRAGTAGVRPFFFSTPPAYYMRSSL